MAIQTEHSNSMPRPEPVPATDGAGPSEECDLVMKGGITSGVVYPAAVLELKDRYRFRSIGGTSVGAMAAAATAAAEYARDTGGFARLAAIQRDFRQKDYLKDLFVPLPKARPLMRALYTVVPGVSQGQHWFHLGLAMVRALLFSHYLAAGIGAAVGTALGAGFAYAMGASFEWRWLFLLLPALLGALLGGASGLLRIFVFALKNSMFGICIGHDHRSDSVPVANPVAASPAEGQRGDRGQAGAAAGAPGQTIPPLPLTDWLHRSIQFIAGRDIGACDGASAATESEQQKPLTFGDLKEKKTSHRGGVPRGIKLRMFTTNLSEGQPYELPFRQQRFLFSEEDMRQVFPCDVVRHLVNNAAKPSPGISLENLPGYHYLPAACDLPVVFGVRLSLSFPVLISAVRLYTFEAEALESASGAVAPTVENLLPSWFSDGGICTNFPIHLFDRWMPPYPTFGFDLTSFPNSQGSPVPAAVREKLDALHGRGKQSQKTRQPDPGKRPVSAGPRPVLQPEFAGADVGGYVRSPDASTPAEIAPYLPRVDAPLDSTDYNRITCISGFLGAILSTARNHHDNMQGMLPSYRERIVQIPFRPGQGGLNLTMSREAIEQIENDGRRAAALLHQQFNFDHHRWVRFRVMGRELEEALLTLATEVDLGSIKDMLDELVRAPGGVPFPMDESWYADATEVVDELSKLIGSLKGLAARRAQANPGSTSTNFFPPLPVPTDMALRVVAEA
jgi:predicted acylesterase/phospholipase RssA